MRNQKVLDMVYLAMFLSIILILALVPNFGFIPLGFASVTIVHIPVIIASIYFGRGLGTLTGLIFGFSSWILAIVRPTQPLDPLFVNPILSVLPRILFGFLTAVVYNVIKKWIKNTHVNVAISAVIGTLIHSVLVLGLLVAIYYDQVTKAGTFVAAVKLAGYVLGTVSLLEAAAAGLIATPIVFALRELNQKDKNFDLIKED